MDLQTAAHPSGAPAFVAPAIAASAARFAYQPALDGVRAVAVTMVLLFHAGFGWMSGGYVGVSVFFTLSGYLITALALVEHDTTGRLAVGAFYSRRIRRLMPASLICIAVVMIAASLDQFGGVTGLRRDLWAALSQVYNWFVLAGGESYADQVSRSVGQRGPLDHYWSLAIEEQFYWLWPPALVMILRRSAGGRLVAIGTLTTAAVVTTIVISRVWGPEATYFATPARLPEILLGALAAAALHHRPAGVGSPTERRVSGRWLAVLALAVILGTAILWPASGGPAYHAWLPLFAVASVVLIVGLQTASPLRVVLSWAPLVLVGRISYGVYLFHWPVYTLVDERRFEMGRTPLFVVRVVLTLAIASLCYVLVERPIRLGRTGGALTAAAAAGACALVAVAVMYVPDGWRDDNAVSAETRAAARIPSIEPGVTLVPLVPLAPLAPSHPPGVPDWSATELSRPARVLIIGDSTAHSTGEGMIEWAAAHAGVLRVTSSAAVGCGLNATGSIPDDTFREVCDEIRSGIAGAVARLRPDVVVAMVTFRDMEDRVWLPSEGILTPTDERFRRHLLDGYEVVTQQLLHAGAGTVVWVLAPMPALPPIGDLAPMLDPDRIESYRRVVRALPVSFPGRVVVADMAGWIDGLSEPPERHDGLHWSLDGAVRVADEFLVPAVLTAALSEPEVGSP